MNKINQGRNAVNSQSPGGLFSFDHKWFGRRRCLKQQLPGHGHTLLCMNFKMMMTEESHRLLFTRERLSTEGFLCHIIFL